MLPVWSACEKFESLTEHTPFGMRTASAVPFEVVTADFPNFFKVEKLELL
jgi:hypothetical protein